MKPFRFSPRFAALFCCAFLAAGLCACAGQSDQRASLADATVRASLGDFTVFAVAADPELPLVQPSLLYKNRDLSQTHDPMRELTPGQSVRDFPLPGCESMKVELFTGGANCCFGYYLLASCPDGGHAAYIEPRNGGVGEAQPALRAYPVDELAFFYYEPANQQGGVKLSLSRVDSPRITRYLVFDGGAWRADRAGELPAAYKALLAQLRGDKTMNRTARAISLAYYSQMAGEKPQAAARVLRRALPKEYAHLAPVILADIQASVDNFNPVRNLVLEQ